MRRTDRQHQILQLLAQGEMQVGELADTLAVSEATIRRELNHMSAHGQLRRVHGGATLDGIARMEPIFSDKQGINTREKTAIAQRALELVTDGSTVYIDGGSTLLVMARLLCRKRNLTIVTNSLMAAANLMDTEHRLILIGGEFRSLSRTLVGPLTAPVIQTLHVDIAFMGTIGFTATDGMTTTDPAEAFTKTQIMSRADRVVLLVDQSKLGLSSLARSGTLSDIDIVVTDGANATFTDRLEQAGVQLIIAPQL